MQDGRRENGRVSPSGPRADQGVAISRVVQRDAMQGEHGGADVDDGVGAAGVDRRRVDVGNVGAGLSGSVDECGDFALGPGSEYSNAA